MVAHTALQLLDGMHCPELEVTFVGHSFSPEGRRSFTVPGVPKLIEPFVNRLDTHQTVRDLLTQRRFLKGLDDADAVYLWPNTPLAVYERAKELGLPIFMERINTHRQCQRNILGPELAKVGIDIEDTGANLAGVAREDAQLALADHIFSPSPMVRASLLDAGIEAERIIDSTYGWAPDRLRVSTFGERSSDPFTALFVGTLCVRKGLHRFLPAWAEANVEGKLLLAGEMGDLAEVSGIDRFLSRPDVVLLGRVEDIAPVFAQSDLFAFPSLEEGSPMVSYEAMAFGLPSLTSPMGAGAVVRPDIDGIVCDPTNTAQWVDSLRRLAGDAELRHRLGSAARENVQKYTWEKVGRRRRKAVLDRLGT